MKKTLILLVLVGVFACETDDSAEQDLQQRAKDVYEEASTSPDTYKETEEIRAMLDSLDGDQKLELQLQIEETGAAAGVEADAQLLADAVHDSDLFIDTLSELAQPKTESANERFYIHFPGGWICHSPFGILGPHPDFWFSAIVCAWVGGYLAWLDPYTCIGQPQACP